MLAIGFDQAQVRPGDEQETGSELEGEGSSAMIIMSCNIRYFGADDGENSWRQRKDLCVQVIRSRRPEVVCFQEMWRQQFEDMEAAFPEWATFGLTDEPRNHNPMNAIFYPTDRFELVSAGGYWLSESPHVPGSCSWDSACVRLANWVRLEERDSGREFRVVNTHLDHVGQLARESQARVICEDAAAYPAEYPQLLTGDMNCDGANRAIARLREGGWRDTYALVHGAGEPGLTFHAFQGPAYVSKVGKMDWVFCRGDVEVAGAEVVTDEGEGRWPSDHYFVTADVQIC